MKVKTFQALTIQEALRAVKAELGPDAVILSTREVRGGASLFGLFGRPMVEVCAAVDVETAETPRFERELRRSAAAPPPTAPAGPDCDWAACRAELSRIRELLESSGGASRGAATLPPPLQAARDRLVRAGLAAGTALELLARLPAGLVGRTGAEDALRRLLVRETRTGGPLLELGDWKKTVMLVGPTGVGKTTTIAKLAAHYHGREKRAVSLVTLDTYRLAAVEQLRLYAKAIGVPLQVALTREELLAFLRRRSGTELILIDTPGRSPLDAAGMEELRRTVAMEQPLETHLVLAATTRDEDLQEAVDRYAALPINRLLFTKLDETTRFGAPFELMRRTGWPLSYLSTGQKVPDDLQVATPERVAGLLLGEGARVLRPAAPERTGEPRPAEGGTRWKRS
jgi:flagellar biosynthesis protein FlhF